MIPVLRPWSITLGSTALGPYAHFGITVESPRESLKPSWCRVSFWKYLLIVCSGNPCSNRHPGLRIPVLKTGEILFQFLVGPDLWHRLWEILREQVLFPRPTEEAHEARVSSMWIP